MMRDIQHLLDTYHAWLKDKSVLRQLDEWIEITTPYLDRHNDYLQIYAKRANGGFLLTDDGYTIGDLEQSGCKLESKKRQELLAVTVNGFGVQLENKALQVQAVHADFALRKHSLVQTMLAVNDMFYLAAPLVTSLFHEDVVKWLDVHEIRHTPKVKFSGTSGYDHLFDFVIPRSREAPERIVRAVNSPSRQTAQTIAFAWLDTRAVRSPESRAYAILNDSDRPVSHQVLTAIQSYDVSPIVWSDREAVFEELAA
jgi:hypothetical protein